MSEARAECDSVCEARPDVAPLACSAVLTHHWLVRRRGGERVLEALRELVPRSPIFTLVHDPRGLASASDAEAMSWWGERSIRVETSILQRFPGARRHYPKLLPLMPWAARRMHLPDVDLVVCSDAALAKAMTPSDRSRVVCYCHSPMRYVWDLREVYRAQVPRPLRLLWDTISSRVRKADRRAARRVDHFVANSRHVAERIRRSYARESVVVHPPVDIPATPSTARRESFYLCLGQHVPYKRLDLAVDACRVLGRELIVIGEGPDVRRLRRSSDPHIRFLGWQPRDVVSDNLRRARGLIFPGEEDFGIVPVEAMGHGCPVIAFGVGGVRDTVIDGHTGVLFDEQTVDSLVGAIERSEHVSFDAVALHAHATRFSRGRFLRRMKAILEDAVNGVT